MADEQVGTPAHDLPADEGEHQITGENHQEHGRQEQGDRSDEDPNAVVLMQVPGGEELNRQPDDGHSDHDDRAEIVHEQVQRYL